MSATERRPGDRPAKSSTAGASIGRWLAPRTISGIYVWILIIVVFSIWTPSTFFQIDTARSVANNYAISGIVALAVIVPLLTGVFDISVGYTVGFAGAVSAWAMSGGQAWWLAALLGVGAGVLVGLVNSFVVIVLRIDPLIATLATGSIINAVTTAVSKNNSIVKNVGGSFSENIANKSLWGFTEPYWFMAILMVVLGLFLEQTKSGRHMYAIGFDVETARLGGVRVKGLQTAALITSGAVAAIAGVALTARIGAYSPGSGPPYLLPAFAGAFLGATQFRNGRFNAWGTVVASLLLGTGQFGILLVGGPVWAPDLFNGAALILAVALAGISGYGPRQLRLLSRLLLRRRSQALADSGDPPAPLARGTDRAAVTNLEVGSDEPVRTTREKDGAPHA